MRFSSKEERKDDQDLIKLIESDNCETVLERTKLENGQMSLREASDL